MSSIEFIRAEIGLAGVRSPDGRSGAHSGTDPRLLEAIDPDSVFEM
jgi:hypothetical protein